MDYARTLAEHPKWRWEPGMAADWFQDHMIGTFLAFIVSAEGGYVDVVPEGRSRAVELRLPDKDLLPSLRNPATKGWLLHMLREATGTQDACATWLGGEWRLYGWIGASALGRFATEGEAIAAALLAVWGAT